MGWQTKQPTVLLDPSTCHNRRPPQPSRNCPPANGPIARGRLDAPCLSRHLLTHVARQSHRPSPPLRYRQSARRSQCVAGYARCAGLRPTGPVTTPGPDRAQPSPPLRAASHPENESAWIQAYVLASVTLPAGRLRPARQRAVAAPRCARDYAHTHAESARKAGLDPLAPQKSAHRHLPPPGAQSAGQRQASPFAPLLRYRQSARAHSVRPARPQWRLRRRPGPRLPRRLRRERGHGSPAARPVTTSASHDETRAPGYRLSCSLQSRPEHGRLRPATGRAFAAHTRARGYDAHP
jgi:hypothetical protein